MVEREDSMDEFSDEPTMVDVAPPAFAKGDLVAPSPVEETRAREAPKTEAELAAAAPAAPQWPQSPAEALDRLKQVSPPKRRELPRRARIAIAGAAALLLVVVLCGRGGTHERKTPALTVPEDVVVSEADLKKRREVSADDFKPKKYLETQPASDPSPAAAPAADALAERRARRANDPEDLIAQKRRDSAGDQNGEPTVIVEAKPRFRLLPPPSGVQAAAPPQTNHRESADRNEVTIATAGTVVPVALVTPIDLTGSSATVIARAAAHPEASPGVPEGSRFVGTVSGGEDGQLSIRFSKLLLPDGREAHVVAEAQDGSGAFGLVGSVETTNPERPSVAGQVAKDTATDVALDALGMGVAGSAARNYSRRSSQAEGFGSYRSGMRVTLPAGTKFMVFLHEAATLRNY